MITRTRAEIEANLDRLDAAAALEMQNPPSKWRRDALDLLTAKRREALRELDATIVRERK